MEKGIGWIQFVFCVVVYISCRPTLEIGNTSVSRESKEPQGLRWGTTLYLWVYCVVLDGLQRHYYLYCWSRASLTTVKSLEIQNSQPNSRFVENIDF